MDIYLPIAEMSVNAVLILALGGAVGFLSGMFGVGGGFLMTPLLIFVGIPPPVAVATQANQVVASSTSGVLAHWRRGTVDFRMGTVLLAGGVLGALLGVWIFSLLRRLGQIDLVISLSYVLFLTVIGTLMLLESVRAIRAARAGRPLPMGRKPGQHSWVHGLPLRMRFRKSKLYISAIPPFVVGGIVGILTSIMGGGGGFFMVPAMIYILRMPTNVVVGTSLLQIIFVTGLVTVLHAVENRTVDFVLALLLLTGGVIGAQFGARMGYRMKAEQLRALLAVLVLAVGARLAYELVARPQELFTLAVGGLR